VKRITRDWLLSAEMDLRSIERVLDDEFLGRLLASMPNSAWRNR